MSFWDFFFLLLIFIPLMLMWTSALLDIFRRDDLGGVLKAIWVKMIFTSTGLVQRQAGLALSSVIPA